ncbi:Rieske 2Fe-2S domain-containing protein [Mameliella sp. AT18]|uniref:Rieske 2Fe-2S domain-containing protein n=1 Tax=Mameliella sp. AT18 TaxID=3028385 RepID=UPI00084113D6|nr:Rieske 2Fe-2S domain-containing protein [Mameliella sp. AT18]MDD9729650.1 Rieske 2Fe-2S domain-containing protein [Mameliella sp. AT18]ODM46685.1 oxidoreductase [Ruegeria sp. PBVC088]
MSDLHSKWYPIASSSDLPKRHVYQAQLLGREFAVWRADDGYVNVWENRCLHRGVRLSIGINNGSDLKCQYHGWRYANRTAGCTYIPAHPADAPARTICNNTYPAQEAHGLVWAGEQASGDLPPLDGFEAATVLRPVPVLAPMEMVVEALLAYGWDDSCSGRANADGSVTVTAADGAEVRLFVQPMDSNRSAIRGVSNQPVKGADRIRLLKRHSWLMQELRSQIEARASSQEAPPPYQPVIARVSEDLVDIPAIGTEMRKAELRVQVAGKEMTAEGIVSLRLKPVKGSLPTFQPGAHIDVHLPNGLVRQYSITNGPGETDHYRIGVKREPNSKGGSAAIHDAVKAGDVLAISAPRNNFPLRRNAEHTIFVAGGIGVTPLISMARALNAQGLSFEFHYFVQSDDHVAFKPQIGEYEQALILHKALTPEATGARLTEILAEPGFARHVYICGPGPMLEAARAIAAEQGWSDETVHFEYFANTAEVDDSTAFEVDLARSAMTLKVPAGKTILEVLRENGIDMPSSCEQGACGTCRCGVIEGAVKHQDVYLSDAEKAEGKSIMTCVSRAVSDRLILDI